MVSRSTFIIVVYRYGDFATLAEIFFQNMKKSDSALEIGCGNSTLSANIYDYVKCSFYLGIDYR